jgi:hypothetical protein
MQRSSLLLAALGSAALAGCSSGGSILPSSLTTQSINGTASTNAQVAAVAPKADPACYSLAQRIEMLRKDGITERIEKASVGKSTSVSVKRASLAQAAELDKANAEFQARCSTLGPRPVQTTASIPGVAPVATANTAQVGNGTAGNPADAAAVSDQRRRATPRRPVPRTGRQTFVFGRVRRRSSQDRRVLHRGHTFVRMACQERAGVQQLHLNT